MFCCSDCNGHAPLNNQRALSPQNSVKGHPPRLSPHNSFHGSHPYTPNQRPVSRQNSLSSRSAHSRQNSFRLSRQNSINSHHTLSPQNSIGSGPKAEEYKQNNLSSETPTQDSLKVITDGEVKETEQPRIYDDEVDEGRVSSMVLFRESVMRW